MLANVGEKRKMKRWGRTEEWEMKDRGREALRRSERVINLVRMERSRCDCNIAFFIDCTVAKGSRKPMIGGIFSMLYDRKKQALPAFFYSSMT